MSKDKKDIIRKNVLSVIEKEGIEYSDREITSIVDIAYEINKDYWDAMDGLLNHMFSEEFETDSLQGLCVINNIEYTNMSNDEMMSALREKMGVRYE